MPKKVLVVDDEPTVLQTTRQLLEDLGFEAVAVDRASMILTAALQLRPDVILQDVRMPGLDLEAVVRAIRAEPELQGVRILLFTAGMEAEELGARIEVPTLEKPFHPQELLAALG